MKTLVKENLSIYIFEDNEKIVISENSISVGDPIKFIIADCGKEDTVLYENATPPDDWSGGKYFYNGNNWSLNNDWVEPKPLDYDEET